MPWARFVGVLVLFAAPALADTGARVVLLGRSDRDPIVIRLRRELELLGMEVELVIDAGAARRALADVARERDASAAVAVETSPSAVVLWTHPSQVPGASAGEEIRVDQALAGTPEPRLLVLRAVELLRERLLPAPASPALPDAGADPGRSPEAPAASSSLAAPVSAVPSPVPVASSARVPSLFVGPALLASPGGVDATPHVWLGARSPPLGRVEVELLGFLPTTAASVSAAQGSMSLRVGALGAGAGLGLNDPASRLFVTASAGLGVMLAAFDGQARPPWRSARGLRWAMLPYAHAAAGYWLGSRLALRADVMTGFALPEHVLTIAGRRAAVFGEPAALFAAGLEVRP